MHSQVPIRMNAFAVWGPPKAWGPGPLDKTAVARDTASGSVRAYSWMHCCTRYSETWVALQSKTGRVSCVCDWLRDLILATGLGFATRPWSDLDDQLVVFILGIYRGISPPNVSKLCKTILLRLLVTGLQMQLSLSLLSANACSV